MIVDHFDGIKGFENVPEEIQKILRQEAADKNAVGEMGRLLKYFQEKFEEALKADKPGLGEIWDISVPTWDELKDPLKTGTYTADLLRPIMADPTKEELRDSLKNTIKLSINTGSLKKAQMMAGLHTVTGNSGFKNELAAKGPTGIVELAKELQKNAIPAVFDNLEALKMFKKDLPDTLAGYFVTNDIEAALEGIAAGAGMVVALEYLRPDVVSILKERAPSVVIINAVSAKDDVLRLVDESVQAGAEGVQFKPFKDFVTGDGFTEAGELLKTVRAKYPELLISGAGAIFEDRVGNVIKYHSCSGAQGGGICCRAGA